MARDHRFACGALSVAAALLLPLLGVACSSSVAPKPRATLLVTNATCAAGHCQSLDVLAFPSEQPETPAGLWSLDLGTFSAAQLCIEIPASARFTVSGPNSNGTTVTTITNWNAGDGLSLGLVTPPGTRFEASPSTPEFAPATAQGWTVTLPGTAAPVPSAPCTP